MSELYLVTGAAGHLGGALLRALAAQGKSVRALVLAGERHLPEGDVEIVYGDVCDTASLEPLFDAQGRELIVIHAAGIVSIASKFRQIVYDVNVTGTKNIVDMCVKHSVKKLVYVSSVHAIPEKRKGDVITEIARFNPDDVIGLYAQTKSEATQYVLDAAANGLDASVVHPSGIIGPGDYGAGHTTALIIDFCKKRLTSATNGGYDFADVRDVAGGIVACCARGRRGECYILSNRYVSVHDLLYIVHEVTGVREIKNFLPLWFVKLTAPLAETFYKLTHTPPLFTSYSIYTLNSNALFSHAKADAELGYTTRDLRETITDTVAWLREHGRV
ncbi:MAG: NAD-dependent epimerase/dehydratase family protein [Oscillospiraceae bacterium]|jgi:dihydroflavonol-4-reductase|nr:NAD-dependent epimerase/dehydratase family protein [Oscillospiraceae bacterium]